MNRRMSVLWVAWMVIGCGGVATERTTMVLSDPVAEGTEISHSDDSQKVSRVISSVTRRELDGLLSSGPAGVLAMVQTDPFRKNGKFVGFRVVSFRLDVDEVLGVRPEDVVVQINGMSIETPDQFFALFEILRTAEYISFALLRDGQPIELRTSVTSD